MKTILLCISFASMALAQNIDPAKGFTIYQTVVIDATRNSGERTFKETESSSSGRLKREYSRHPDGREVLAEANLTMLNEPGHPLHGRRIWEPSGVMVRVVLPWKNFDVVVEPNNERLSGHAKPGSQTCEPELSSGVYVGSESLLGLFVHRWRFETAVVRTDRWYWKDANCLEVQVESLGKDASGAVTHTYAIRLDRVSPNTDSELFFIPDDFVEGSANAANERYMQKTQGKDYLKKMPLCYRNAAARPDPYAANHAEALRRRALSTTTNSDKQ